MTSVEQAVENLARRQDLETQTQEAFTLAQEVSYKTKEVKPKAVLFGLPWYDRAFWRRISGKPEDVERVTTDVLRPRNVIEPTTYRAITGRIDAWQLYLLLGQNGTIRDESVKDFQDGFVYIPHLDQLAISRLSTATVIERSNRGDGIWPVDEGEFAGIDLDKLRIPLSPEQREFLQKSIYEERKAKALWFREDVSTSTSMPNQGADYLPAASEVLRVFELFYNQEGYYPDSSGWFRTRSLVPLSLGVVYRECFVDRDPHQIFIDSLIERSSYATTIHKYLAIKDNFSANVASGGVIERKKGVLEVTTGYDDVVFIMSDRELFIRTRSGSEIHIKSGEVTMKNIIGDVTYTSSLESVLEEINQIIDDTQPLFDEEVTLPVILSSKRRDGVDIGLLLNSDSFPSWRLLNGGVIINPLRSMEPFIEAQLHGINCRKEAFWPSIFPEYAT